MGTEKITTFPSNENIELSVPPGFVSLTSFTLKKRTTNDEACTSGTEAEPSCTGSIDPSEIMKQRPRVLYDELEYSQKGSDPQREMDFPLKACLPKGVIRGCSSCVNCQKVISKWRPEESCRLALEEAPVFHPTEKEFEDTLKYIASISRKTEHFGMCRIVPPPSWKPPCLFREKRVWQNSKFETHVQRIDELKNLYLKRRLDNIDEDTTIKRRKFYPESTGHHESSNECAANSISVPCPDESSKSQSGPEFTLQDFEKYANDFKSQYFSIEDKCVDLGVSSNKQTEREPSVEDVEGEYWRIIEKPSEEIEVLCGINVSTSKFGSGFPVHSNSSQMSEYLRYTESGWNLNNTPMLPCSLLKFENSNTTTASVPKLFVGMCFSSLCWKVEEHHLYSLCYMHLGSPKIWYSIPARYCYKFEGIVKKHLEQQYSEQPEPLWKLITQLPPSLLKSEGIPVYRCVQSAGEFVLTCPAAYHCELDCGFNCSEKVNVATFDWLPYGQEVAELYSEQCRKTSISHDKVLLGAANAAVMARLGDISISPPGFPALGLAVQKSKLLENMQWISISGKDGILTKLLKLRVIQEARRREYLCNSLHSQRMEDSFDITTKRECSICLFDLHFSAIGCSCSPGKYTCLQHAKYLCGCAWNDKYLLFRYEINELNVLVKAVKGNLVAVRRWATEKFRMKMSSAEAVESPLFTEATAPVIPVSPSVASSSSGSNPEFKKKKPITASSSCETNVIILSSDEEDV